MIITKQPLDRHAAFDPIIVNIGKEASDTQTRVDIDVKLDGNIVSKFSRPFMCDVARFDLSGVIRTLFDEELPTVSGNATMESRHLCVPYSAVILGTNYGYNAYHSAIQYGNPFGIYNGGFLTGFERLLRYEGYPQLIVFVPFKGTYTYLRRDDREASAGISKPLLVAIMDANTIVRIYNNNDPLELNNNDNEVITTNTGEIIYVMNGNTDFKEARLPVEVRCTPSSPFYVRWLNMLGGYDYWMFQFRQTKSISLESSEMYERFVYDPSAITNPMTTIKKVGVKKITVGAYGLNDNEFENIANLAYSPRIEWYNEELGKWVFINLEKAENTHDSRSNVQNIEFEFLLPKPNLQF